MPKDRLADTWNADYWNLPKKGDQLQGHRALRGEEGPGRGERRGGTHGRGTRKAKAAGPGVRGRWRVEDVGFEESEELEMITRLLLGRWADVIAVSQQRWRMTERADFV